MCVCVCVEGVSLQDQKFEIFDSVAYLHPPKNRVLLSQNLSQATFCKTKSLNTKQCPAGVSPYYPHKHLWIILGMGEILSQQPKIYFFPTPEKSPSKIDIFCNQKCYSFPHQIAIFI